MTDAKQLFPVPRLMQIYSVLFTAHLSLKLLVVSFVFGVVQYEQLSDGRASARVVSILIGVTATSVGFGDRATDSSHSELGWPQLLSLSQRYRLPLRACLLS